jgi:cytochrome b561
MLLLVVIHVAAALRHHLLLRDSVLLRMAPVLGRR